LIIWEDGDFLVWKDPISKRGTIRCSRREEEVEILLVKPPVPFGATSVEFGKECLKFVDENFEVLLERWKKI
jgi:hypothetical protein